jgi:addiction module HigA family antidote
MTTKGVMMDRKPAEVFHPGVHLLDELHARGLQWNSLALQIGMSAWEVEKIIYGKKDITQEIANKLSKALGTSAEYWLSLQRAWDEREK